MKNKNCDLDSYYTKLRAPFEHVFSKQNKRVRYQGIAKNQFSAFMQAITFNFKTCSSCLSSSASNYNMNKSRAVSTPEKTSKIIPLPINP